MSLKPAAIAMGWILLFMACAGGLLVHGMTGSYGVGHTTDSVTYTQAAQSLNLGRGLAVADKAGVLTPMAYHAPAFPVVLAGGWFAGLSFPEWARFLNALFFGMSIFLAGCAVFYVTQSRRAGCITAALLLLTVQIVEGHAKLLSEPLFLTMMMVFFLCWFVFLKTAHRGAFYTAALSAGLLMLIRYPGAVFIIAVVVWFLCISRDKNRYKDAFFFFVVSGALPLLWLVRNYFLTGYGTGTPGGIFPPTLLKMYVLFNTLSEWFLPARVPGMLRWAVLGLGVGFLVGSWRRGGLRLPEDSARILRFLGVTLLIYGAVGWITSLIKAGDIYFNHRLFLPVYAGAALAAGLCVPVMLPVRNWPRRIVAGCCILFCLLGAARVGQLAVSVYKNGYGYSAKALGASRLAETLRSLDDTVPLYADDPEALYFFTGRTAVKIPAWGEDTAYMPPFVSVAQDFREKRAVAVIFNKDVFRPDSTWQALSEGLQMELFFKDISGDIYGVKRK